MYRSISTIVSSEFFVLIVRTTSVPERLVTGHATKDENVTQMLVDHSPSVTQSVSNLETLELSSTDLEFSKGFGSPDLTRSSLGQKGSCLSEFIERQGDNPQLKTISLRQYSMPKPKWAELVQFTSGCKFLSHLDLSRNAIDETGITLARSITSLGSESQLKELVLIHCSMQEHVWVEILQSLSCYKQLSHLDLSENNFGEAGHYLAQSITSWGDNPPLKKLFLESSSLTEQVCTELLQSLSSCKQLTHLNLSQNTIGEAGRYLAQFITSWRDNSQVEYLSLHHCSMPEDVWNELLQSLSSCKKLFALNLSGNAIGEAGHHLAKSITSWGDNPPMGYLDLSNCSIPDKIWPKLFQSLSCCKHLKNMYLSENTVTGSLSSFVPESSPGLPSLKCLQLMSSAVSKEDVQHLTHLIKRSKLR